MTQFLLGPAAKSDLVEIWNYSATEVGDVDLADNIRAEVLDGIPAAARTPDIGHPHRDLANRGR